MKCLDLTPTSVLLKAETDYLLSRYEASSSQKSSGNCEELLKHRPTKIIHNLATIEIVPILNAEKMLPIIWLACTQEKVRTELFLFDESDETVNDMKLNIYGVDLAENKLLGESKNIITDTVEITDTMIDYSKEREFDNKNFDFMVLQGRINRVSGAYLETFEFKKNGNLTSKVTKSGKCDLMDASKRKF